MNTKQILTGLFLSITFLITSVLIVSTGDSQVDPPTPQGDEIFVDDEGTTLAPQIYVDNIDLIQNEYVTGGTIGGNFSIYNAGLQTASEAKYRVDLMTVTVDENGFVTPLELITSSETNSIPVIQPGESKVQFSIKIPNTLPKGNQFGIGIVVLTGNEEVGKSEVSVTIGGNLVDFVDYNEAALFIGDDYFLVREGPTLYPNEKIGLYVDMTSLSAQANLIPNLKIISGPNKTGEVVFNVNLETFNVPATGSLIKTFELPTNFDPAVYTGVFSLLKDGNPISAPLEIRYILSGIKPKIGAVSFSDVDQNQIEDFVVTVSYDDIPVSARVDENGNFIDSRAESVYIRNAENVTEEQLNNTTITGDYVLPDNLSLEVSIFDKMTGMIIDTRTLDRLIDSQTEINFSPIKDSETINVVINLKENGQIIDTKETELNIIPRTKGNWPFMDLVVGNPMIAVVAGFILLVLIVSTIILVTTIRKRHRSDNLMTQ